MLKGVFVTNIEIQSILSQTCHQHKLVFTRDWFPGNRMGRFDDVIHLRVLLPKFRNPIIIMAAGSDFLNLPDFL